MASLKSVRQNFLVLSNLPSDKSKRNSLNAALSTPVGIGAHPDIGSGLMFGLPLAKGNFGKY